MGGGSYNEPGGLHEDVMAQLDDEAEAAGIATRHDTAPARFRHLIRALHRQVEHPVVVLVDEYDKPILDALEEPETARANRDYLRSLYATIKSSDAHVRFTMLTGVSKFSKVSLFSGLNNLIDITLDPRYSAICGYTEADLDTVFAPELPGLDRDEIRDWYNGYSWLGEEKVYNPFDILLLFDKRKFEAWWFETGTPSFLVDMLFQRRVSSLASTTCWEAATCCRRSTSITSRRRRCCSRPAISPSPGRSRAAGKRSTGWATRTGRCGGA